MWPVQYAKHFLARSLKVLQSPFKPRRVREKTAEASVNLTPLADLPGFMGACLVDSKTGTVRQLISVHDATDLELDAVGNIDVIRVAKDTVSRLSLDDQVDHILISLGNQHHMLRPLKTYQSLFIYLVLDKSLANLGMVTITLRQMD